MPLSIVILAAGKGTRMRSETPKVLHDLGGKPLLKHVIDTAGRLNPSNIFVVIGHGGEQITEVLRDEPVHWVEQLDQLGTGHAVQQAIPQIPSGDNILILYGDVPLTRLETLTSVVESLDDSDFCLLTAELDDPSGYGRIIRDPNGNLAAIVEHKDSTLQQQAIKEINTGILAANGSELNHLLDQLNNNNAQGEYYLTDTVELARNAGLSLATITVNDIDEVSGVNDRVQLAKLERVYQHTLADRLMREGASLRDPARIDVRGELSVGCDSIIDVNCVFIGTNVVGENVSIGPNCTIVNSHIDNGAIIEANCVIENSVIGEQCAVGPFARMRPNTVLEKKSKLGNFVETKNSNIGVGSKVNHLSYVGDSDVAASVNIGAGVITANYDGANKHRTTISDEVFIGSNSVLVAPINVGKRSTIGAGSTLSKNVGEDELVFTRARAKTIAGWQRPKKDK